MGSIAGVWGGGLNQTGAAEAGKPLQPPGQLTKVGSSPWEELGALEGYQPTEGRPWSP